MSFDIHVVDTRGDDVGGMRVMLEFTSIFRGVSKWVYSDIDGHAIFEGHENGEIRVFIDGEDYGLHRYKDGSSITIVL